MVQHQLFGVNALFILDGLTCEEMPDADLSSQNSLVKYILVGTLAAARYAEMYWTRTGLMVIRGSLLVNHHSSIYLIVAVALLCHKRLGRFVRFAGTIGVLSGLRPSFSNGKLGVQIRNSSVRWSTLEGSPADPFDEACVSFACVTEFIEARASEHLLGESLLKHTKKLSICARICSEEILDFDILGMEGLNFPFSLRLHEYPKEVI